MLVVKSTEMQTKKHSSLCWLFPLRDAFRFQNNVDTNVSRLASHRIENKNVQGRSFMCCCFGRSSCRLGSERVQTERELHTLRNSFWKNHAARLTKLWAERFCAPANSFSCHALLMRAQHQHAQAQHRQRGCGIQKQHGANFFHEAGSRGSRQHKTSRETR